MIIARLVLYLLSISIEDKVLRILKIFQSVLCIEQLLHFVGWKVAKHLLVAAFSRSGKLLPMDECMEALLLGDLKVKPMVIKISVRW